MSIAEFGILFLSFSETRRIVYLNNPKNLDTRKVCCNHPKF